MPLPEPKNNENEKEFISRCASELSDMGEFDSNKQRVAVCYTQWRKKDEMDIIKKINKLLPESKFPIYGEKKSKEYLKFRQDVFDATKDSQLTNLMKQMEMSMKKGKLDYEEMVDLIDKVDQKKMKLNKGGKRASGSKKVDKFQNKVRNKR